MAVDVRIKQKGLFKKKINIQDIISLKQLSFGTFDENFVLDENKTGTHTILFDKQQLARGIEVWFDEEDACLSLSLPTTWEENELFYELIKEICALFKTKTFIRDEIEVNVKNIDDFVELDVKTSIKALEELQLKCEEYHYFQILGVIHPISLGHKEFNEINGNLDRFRDLLNRYQQVDAYFANPKVYRKNSDQSLFGAYFISEKIVSIVPTKPYVFMNKIENVENWYVFLSKDEIVSYDDFIQSDIKKEYYDSNHVVVCLTKEEIEDLVSQYKTKI